MKKLITYLTKEDEKWLTNRITHPGVYTIPSMEEIKNYLDSVYDNEPSEIVLYDLIIQYSEDDDLMFEVNI